MATRKKKVSMRGAFIQQRNNVLTLLAKNQNYFGTHPTSKLKASKLISNNVFYEEITCVGYNPKSNDLFATFELKRAFGYSGNLCTKGSREYIRFYVDYGSGWLDQGMVAVNVHDIPTEKDCFKSLEKPLCYTASIPLKDLKKRFCRTEVLPKVCAILSWGIPIPAGNHKYNPIWGNKVTCQVQLKPYFFPWFDLIEKEDLFVPKFLDIAQTNPNLTVSQVTELVNETSPKPVTFEDYKPQELNLSEVAKLYKYKKGFCIPPLRFTLPTLLQLKNNPQELQLTNKIFKKIPGLNLSDLMVKFDKTKANTSFEELECLGLDYNRNRLAATFRVKLPNGYAGTLCRKGSHEHVAFWADWDDDCKWTYLGMSSVNVHDLKKIDKKGICYTAYLPVNMDKYRKSCKTPKVVRIRAVLSWNSQPSKTDPNDLNTYGNRLDTHIQLKPLQYRPGLYPFFSILGGIPVSEINNATGLTLPTASFALNGLPPDSLGRPCPFAKRVVVQGPLHPGHRYRVQVRKVGSPSWVTLVKPYKVVNNASISSYHHPGADGYFNYLSDAQNNNNILAWWDTSGDDKWEVKINIQGMPGEFKHVIQLNHTSPVAEIDISGSGIVGAGNCNDYFPGDKLQGTFVARSSPGYHGRYTLGTNVPGATITRVPIASGSIPTAPSPGDNWSMTIPAGTSKCGYYVAVSVEDRTILNSTHAGWWDHDTASFCVR